ncbi:MAG: SH3 domain protein [Thiomicrorhabdus sp.]|nr:MAG: SH3 domain protein [Thiomicrorhabdus sp.]
MKKFNNFRNSIVQASKTIFATSILGLALISLSSAANAAKGYTNYVTDSVEIPMRRKPGYTYKIIRMVKSGSPVKILKVDTDGWAQIEYRRKGKTYLGWMPSNVLQNQPIAKVRLARQVKKMNAVEEKYNALKQELATLKARFDETSKELSTTKQEKFEIDQDFNSLKSISGKAVELDAENQQFKLRLSSLEDQNTIMKEQIDQSEDAIKRQWFLTGGGVLLLGLLIGRFVRVPGKRKKWGEI